MSLNCQIVTYESFLESFNTLFAKEIMVDICIVPLVMRLFDVEVSHMHIWLGIAVLLLFFTYFRLRLCKLNKRQQLLQRQVDEKTLELKVEKEEITNNIKIIEAQNREKDVLISEIHHRVKNNLQYISSMVDMQRLLLKSEEGKRILAEIQRRISSMSLVHEMLYVSDNLSQIAARDYLIPLVESINKMVNKEQLPISVKTRVCMLNMSVSDCTSLGMITSEAISNSIKYAFDSTENPKIIVDLFHNKEHSMLTLRIRDNGVGIDNQYLDGNSQSFGLRLIKIFTAQLKGTCEIFNNSGTEILITFKDKNYESPDL